MQSVLHGSRETFNTFQVRIIFILKIILLGKESSLDTNLTSTLSVL